MTINTTTTAILRDESGNLLGQDQRMDRFHASIHDGDYKGGIAGMAREMLLSGMDKLVASNLIESILRANKVNPVVTASVGEKVDTVAKEIKRDSEAYYVDAHNNLQRRKIFSTAKELRERSRKPVSWLVKDFFELNAVSMIWGPPGSGKSFVAMDIAACVATGVKWNGNRVDQGAVFYFAGEGHEGLGRRLDAWTISTGVDCSEDFFISDFAINMFDEKEAQQVVEEIRQTVTNNPVKLIVIDTLARSMIGGDENSAVDMSKFMNYLDRFLIKPLKSNVLIIHHSGVEGGRYRGSSAIKGALDQEFEVTSAPQPGCNQKLVCHKMKDAAKPRDQKFVIKQVYIDTYQNQWDEKEMSFSACSVFADLTLFDEPEPRDMPLTHAQLLRYVHDGDWESQEVARKHFGVGSTKIRNMVNECVKAKWLEKDGDRKPVVITDAGKLEISLKP